MSSRREFLKATLAGSPLIALASTVPGFLARTARAATAEKAARVLVVIQLDGGNDGINTVVPFADEGYAKHRKLLRIRADTLLKFDGNVGLHPSMRDAASLWESGRLAVLPGVGYPNPNRSHFESMAIWQTARLDPEEGNALGWLGQGLDAASTEATRASSLCVGNGATPLALRGRRSVASVMERVDELSLDTSAVRLNDVRPSAKSDDLLAYVRRSTLDAYASSDRIAALTAGAADATRYPEVALADRLRTVARLLKGGHPARVYYTSQTGYDTHAGQLGTHSELLYEFSTALRAFLDDLAASGLEERVLVMAFSEFGRRVAENSSIGTDHGTSGLVFLAGPHVRPGLVGKYPSLTDLSDGDLKTLVDFRAVYATILARWLDLPSEVALGGKFEPLTLLKS
jgi:uncharacterized protein (DUF1501 family)